MNHLIILSGGTGSRMKSDIPKQYIEVYGKPIISYTLKCFDFSLFESIVIVAADAWKDFIQEKCEITNYKSRFVYAKAGASRQESIFNGLNAIKNIAKNNDLVVIHDAARACCSKELVEKLIAACEYADGAMPVLSVKDTVYLSIDGTEITSLLNRDQLYCGQAPEAFKYGHYFEINEQLSAEELSLVRGSSEIAFKNGMKIALVEGDENNFKITTPADLERFIELKKKEFVR